MSKATSVRSKLPTKFWAERTFNPKQEASMSDRYIPTPHDGQYRPEDLINGRRDAEERCNPHPFTSPARSEEHTSELKSLMRTSYAVFCLKKQTTLHL